MAVFIVVLFQVNIYSFCFKNINGFDVRVLLQFLLTALHLMVY